MEFLETCHLADLAILGVEGFEIKDKYLSPRLDIIADFSENIDANWDQYKELTYKNTKQFLQNFAEEKRHIE